MRRIFYLALLLPLVLGLVSGCALFRPPLQSLILNPGSGAVLTEVTVLGNGFGPSQGASVITFGGVPASVVSWSDTSITAKVPVIATPNGEPNTIIVSVAVDGASIGTALFTVMRGVLFVSERDANKEIYLMNPDGTNQANLTNHPESDDYPAWAPDGTKIAFHTSRNGQPDVYVMNADGTGATNLTPLSERDSSPVWSPNGEEIAFLSGRDEDLEIYVIRADGTGERNLTNYIGEDGWPSWSPDGSKIAFHSKRAPSIHIEGTRPRLELTTPNYDVFVIDADGSDLVRLTEDSATDWLPSWSPDGSKIVFQSNRDGVGEVFVMNANGSDERNITNHPAMDGWPTWSPDGSKIAFQSQRDGNTEIYMMNPDGTGLTRLTSNAEWDAGPSWSPDGTRIVFETARHGSFEIYVMDADGANQTRLTVDYYPDRYPVWTETRWIWGF